MYKIMMLALANIKKTKGHSASMIIMFLITALLMNIGLLISVNFGSFFEKKVEELNASDTYYLISDNQYTKEIDEYLRTNDTIVQMQKEECLSVSAEMIYGSNSTTFSTLINDIENQRELSMWELVGESLPLDKDCVYAPYSLQVSGGYSLNDTLEMSIDGTTITLTIKGFFEDTFFTSSDTGIFSFYLPHDSYQKVCSALDTTNNPEYKATLVFANLATMNNDVKTGINDLINANTTVDSTQTKNPYSFNRSFIEYVRTTMASILAIMLVAFSIVFVLVSLIVVKFRIGNSLKEDMTKIGTLKSIGYTSKQIISSILLQFSLIAFVGSVIGMFFSYLLIPFVSDVFAQQSGFKWTQGFDPIISGSVLLLIILVVVAIALISARKINKLNPIVALRSGIVTHNFRKNHTPLDTSRGNISLVLALKSIFQNSKQNIMITIILIAISFSASFALVMYYNTAIDTTLFKEFPGVELSNVAATLDMSVDAMEFKETIQQMPGVENTAFLDQAEIVIEDNDVFSFIMADYSQKKTQSLYEGRYPLHDNEIVIAGLLADSIGKKVGDTVMITQGVTSADYLITGLTQGTSKGGMDVSLTVEGMQRVNRDFKQQELQIYLDDGVDTKTFISKLDTLYGEQIVFLSNMEKNMEESIASYIDIVFNLGMVILIATLVIVSLVLYFVINSTIVHKKRELGIQKAIGFTTLQLMNQISLGLLPCIIVGVSIGSILGILGINDLLSIALRVGGIMKANFIVMPIWITVFGVGICLFSYAIAMLITARIRKISAYTLVSD